MARAFSFRRALKSKRLSRRNRDAVARRCATYLRRAIWNGRFHSTDIRDAAKNNKTSTSREVTPDTALAHRSTDRGRTRERGADAQARRHADRAFRNPFDVGHAGNRPHAVTSARRVRNSRATFARAYSRASGLGVSILSRRTETTSECCCDSAWHLARYS